MSKGEQFRTTKILFVDCDETSFEVRQCMAKVLDSLPPIELFHVKDACEALAMLDQICPDVIVLDDEEPNERDMLIDSLAPGHPPIVLRTETNIPNPKDFHLNGIITYIPKNESLDGIHQTLLLITAIGVRNSGSKQTAAVH